MSANNHDLNRLLTTINDELPKETWKPFRGGWPGQIEAALIDAVLSIRATYGSESNGVRIAVARYRVGELCKRLLAADPERFSDQIWRQAARNRDFVVHHDRRVDEQALWITVSISFLDLGSRLASTVG